MPGGKSGEPREIAVFRHNLFRISEPFITQQAGQLRRFKPLYIGRLRYGNAPAGASSLALRDAGGFWAMPRIGLQMISRDPAPYLRLLAGHRPALIHAHFGIEGVYALPVARRLGIPLVTTFHGFDATLSTAALLSSPAWANYPLFRKQLARRGDLFLCASSFIRERVLAMGFPEARTHTHYIGVDCEAIRPRDPAEETPTILHVGRLVQVKGAEYLIRAFAHIVGRDPAVQLVLIGDGPLKDSLHALVRSLGLEGRVRFLGALPHDQVLAWMRKAAMLVLPSVRTATGRVEGLGMVLLEAAATGVPAIGSHIGGIPEGIIDGETGFLVAERDIRALALSMGRLMDNRETRLRMGEKARAHVEKSFDIRRQTELLEAFYDTVLVR
jgi:glycosyltransferase involved in cell wall biosynthesis